MNNKNDNKKSINKKEVKNIALAGAAGGTAGAMKGAGDVAISNYKTYKKIKNAYVDKHLNDYIKSGMSKKEAYKKVIEEFSKKKIALNKVIPGYAGDAKHYIGNAYYIKAMSEAPYKVVGGALAGVPLGMLAYGQISNLIQNLDKKASDNMVYFEKVTKIVK